MSENTKIEWCDHTFNPWEGCQKVGPGCDHCYAEVRNARFGGGTATNWGPGASRRRTSPKNWALPVKWNKRATIMQNAWAHGVALHGGDETACIAAGFIKPQRPKVFCASLADVFDNAVDPQWRDDLWELIWSTPNLDWLLLTKRVGNVSAMLPEEWGNGMIDRWPHVWIGATIVNQEEADRDIPKLLAVPAAKRFLSMEPLLGPVNLRFKIVNTDMPIGIGSMTPAQIDDCATAIARAVYHAQCLTVDWVIAGGESGPNARPMHPDWARSLRDQCQAAGVPFLFKQFGEWAPGENIEKRTGSVGTVTWFGGKWQHRATDLACVEGHVDDEPDLYRVGKKAAGRLLDGRTWDGFPS